MANNVWHVALPAALAGALVGGAGWMLASQGGAEAAPRTAAARRPALSATKYDRVTASGNVFYKVPAGYKAVQRQGSVIMVRQADITTGDFNGYLLLTDGFALDTKIKAKLKVAGKEATVQAIAVAAGGLADDPDAKFTPPQLANDPAADGYEGYLLLSQSEDKDAGKPRYTQYVVILTGDRAEVAMRIAFGTTKVLEAMGDDFLALTNSMEFRSAGAPPPTRLATALPSDLAVITPRPKPAPVQSARGRDGGSGEGSGVVCRNEPRFLQRQNVAAAMNGQFVLESYWGAKQVCRKNGKIVSIR